MAIEHQVDTQSSTESNVMTTKTKVLSILAATYIIGFVIGLFWMGVTASEEDARKDNLAIVNEITKNYVGAVPIDNSFTFKQIDGKFALKNNYSGTGNVKFATETRECTFLLNAKTMTCQGGIPEVTVKE